MLPFRSRKISEHSGFSTEHRNTAPPFLTPGCLAPLFAFGEPTSKLQISN
ncbi:Uncharacterized protein BM_BM1103 [Brugia malayi]|uniref:Bm1103 n=1 Tax=Brugia malayi TaxID=6279 RepID=A0A0J9Y6E6_BRUMA|nr:Uncharacterized protein BM_BM1103 [Brugia malayi]CDQ03272.1 Bm1103 [Brugia malayi]VIO90471.1 Uncharacterized protein BM_BM1103 [Brugia malayi]